MDKLKAFLWSWLAQSAIAFDQLLNAALLPLFTWTVGYADETLSARAWRMFAKKRFWGYVFRPLIDLLFLWQKPDAFDANGAPIKGHCLRSFLKEKGRRNMPPEYRDDAVRTP